MLKRLQDAAYLVDPSVSLKVAMTKWMQDKVEKPFFGYGTELDVVLDSPLDDYVSFNNITN